jgi:phage tail-like protein
VAEPATPAASPGTWVDPYPAYNFKIMIGGQPVAHFSRVGPIIVDVGTAEYREAGHAQVVHQIPTITTYQDVSLKYGVTSSTVMWDWFYATTQGAIQRKNVSVVVLDSTGATPVLQWDLIGTLPKRWVSPEMDATARAVAVEEIVLSVESVKRAV